MITTAARLGGGGPCRIHCCETRTPSTLQHRAGGRKVAGGFDSFLLRPWSVHALQPADDDENNLPLPLLGEEGNRKRAFPLLAPRAANVEPDGSIRPPYDACLLKGAGTRILVI